MTATASCPICSTSLTLLGEGEFNTWTCPKGHGLAATLTESYEVGQEDDLRRLWQTARDATAASGARSCPMCTKPMVSISAAVDPDEADEGQPGDTPDTDALPVDVCLEDQLIWFDTGEVDRLPADLPEPELTAEQRAMLAQLREQAAKSVDDGSELSENWTDRLAERLLASHGAFGWVARGLGRVGERNVADALDEDQGS